MTNWTDEELDTLLAAVNPVPRNQKIASTVRFTSAGHLLQLLEETRDPRPLTHLLHRRWPRLTLAASAAAVLVLGAVLTVSQLEQSTKPKNAASQQHQRGVSNMSLVAFSTQSSGDIVAKITDPDAPAKQLDAVFAAHHLNITVTVLPVSPSLVGTIVYDDGPDFQPIHAGSCLAGGTQCTVGFIIPADFSGHANVAVGRAASPGELYDSADSSFGPGEALHCAGVINQPVSVAAPILAQKHLTVEWRDATRSANLSTAPTTYFVVNAIPISSTTVMITVQPTALAKDTADLIDANAGC